MRTTSLKSLDPVFIQRQSPYGFEKDPIPECDLKTIFEAARWSPSCYNEQPWLYVYAQGGEALKEFQSTLMEANQKWANDAPVLIMLFAQKHFERNGKENRWAAFDAGASWMALALQAEKLGYKTHAMGGFYADKTFEVAGVDPKKYDVMAVIALGKGEAPDKSSGRKDLQEITIERT